METITGLAVIAVAALFVWGAQRIIERYRADELPLAEFDSYPLPAREDFTLESRDDLYDLVTEGLLFYGLTSDEVSALRTFAEDKQGWHYGDIFRAFYRAQLGIK